MSDDASIDELKLGSLQLEAPPDDDPLRLPNELIIDIMRHLLAAGAKWTLSNLMRANRVCHELGLPLMYREFTVNSFVDPAKVADAGYAHFVRRLDIIYIGDDTAGLERLLAAVSVEAPASGGF